MKLKNNSHTTNVDSLNHLINEMAASPERFRHLQVFMHREREENCNTNYEFLMVTSSSFGKVVVKDLTLVNDTIVLTVRDCVTGKVGDIILKISEVNPKVLFICWQDIKKMVNDDSLGFKLP
jgi:hypothetical protein